MPVTDFLSYTRVFDEFESLSPAQSHHAKTYATGLVAASNKTVAGIAREVLPAGDKRALNRFLTEYDWDEHQFNHERIGEPKNTVKHAGRRMATSSSTTRSPRKPGTKSPMSATSTITPKATLSGAKTSSTPSTLTTKPPIRSLSASTKNRMETTKTTTPSTISPAELSPNLNTR